MNEPSRSIIIVNWNAGQQLSDCISSICCVMKSSFTLAEVVVVDNGSTDDSLVGIEQLGVSVCAIRNNENRGFAAACNQGAPKASADYLLFLNPDTRWMRMETPQHQLPVSQLCGSWPGKFLA